MRFERPLLVRPGSAPAEVEVVEEVEVGKVMVVGM
jgi:hypothetical protein